MSTTTTATPTYISTKDLSREQWLEHRNRGIGGSDAGKVLGVSEYGTQLDVWLDKVNDFGDQPDNATMRYGRDVEAVLAKWFTEDTGLQVQNDHKLRFHPEHAFIIANMDRMILSNNGQGPGVLEIKTTNYFADKKRQEQYGTSIDPSWYVQLQHYLLVTGYAYGYIAYLVDRNFHIKRFEVNQELHEQMVESYTRFWTEHVEANVPPPPETGDEVMKLIDRSEPGKEVEADDMVKNVHDTLNQLKAERKQLDKEIEQLEDKIKVFMGDAEVLTYDGQKLATWKTSDRFDKKAFKQAHPDLFEQYRTKLDTTALRKEQKDLYNQFKSEAGSRRFLIKSN